MATLKQLTTRGGVDEAGFKKAVEELAQIDPADDPVIEFEDMPDVPVDAEEVIAQFGDTAEAACREKRNEQR